MIKKNNSGLGLALWLLTGLLLMSAGCGYRIYGHSSLPFNEISIGIIENRTFEPKLQDKLHKALAEEFLKHGISVNRSAKIEISGVITKFELVSLLEKKDVTVEYRVNILADFRIKDGEGKIKDIKKVSSPFIVAASSEGSGDLGTIIGAKAKAEEKAMADIAMEIVGALIYK